MLVLQIILELCTKQHLKFVLHLLTLLKPHIMWSHIPWRQGSRRHWETGYRELLLIGIGGLRYYKVPVHVRWLEYMFCVWLAYNCQAIMLTNLEQGDICLVQSPVVWVHLTKMLCFAPTLSLLELGRISPDHEHPDGPAPQQETRSDPMGQVTSGRSSVGRLHCHSLYECSPLILFTFRYYIFSVTWTVR